MSKKFLIIAVILLMFSSCASREDDNKSTTEPIVKVESIETTNLSPGQDTLFSDVVNFVIVNSEESFDYVSATFNRTLVDENSAIIQLKSITLTKNGETISPYDIKNNIGLTSSIIYETTPYMFSLGNYLFSTNITKDVEYSFEITIN